MELSARKGRILSAIVETYVATGEPVGSKYLCGRSDLPVSSATVRNEMAELSALGLLEQPHTSAGRIPSQRGFRYYIEKLMGHFQPSAVDMFRIRSHIDQTEGDPTKLLATAAGTLAELTGYAAVVSTPFDTDTRVRRTDLVPLGGRNVMLVLSTTNGTLKSRFCRCEAEVTYEMLDLFYSLSASTFVNLRLDDVTTGFMQTLAASLGEKAFEMAPLLTAFSSAVAEASESEVLVGGLSNLYNFRELDDCAGEIIAFLRKRAPVTGILRTGAGRELTCLIGSENLYRELQGASVLFSGYRVGGREAGAIGLVGPVRMDYAAAIPLVKYMASLIGDMLEENTQSY